MFITFSFSFHQISVLIAAFAGIMGCKNVIVDCDPGTDDAQALMMLLEAHKSKAINILAITCVAGNTFIENIVNNVFRILHVCDTSNVSNLTTLSKKVNKGPCTN